MDRMIHTLYEQHYYSTKIKKTYASTKKILDKSKLVISETEHSLIEDANFVKYRIKDEFSNLYDQFDLFIFHKPDVKKNTAKPDKIIINPDPIESSFTVIDKNEKIIETIQMVSYEVNINRMLRNLAELMFAEFNQLSFFSNLPMKFLLQPIVLYNKKHLSEMISVVISLYDDGFLIIDFDFLFNDVFISDLHHFYDHENKEHYLNRMCLVPNIVIDRNSKNPNLYSKDEITISEAIDYYISYIDDLFGSSIDKNSNETYINYSLINYEGEPENFHSVSNDLKSDLYWIANMPRNNTEQSNSVYDQFIKNHYEINKNAALLLSTVSRSLIVMTKEKFKIDGEDLNTRSHMFTLKSYIDPVIRICMIKKMYYHTIWNFKTSTNDSDIKEKEDLIYKSKEKLNKITLMSYGSVRRCFEYYERNMVDFLNFSKVDDVLSSYKDLKYLEMTEENEKLNNRFNILVLILTIIFSYDPLEKILIGLRDSKNIDFTIYLFEIYLALCIIVSIFVIFTPIKNAVKKIYLYFRLNFTIRVPLKNKLIKLWYYLKSKFINRKLDNKAKG